MSDLIISGRTGQPLGLNLSSDVEGLAILTREITRTDMEDIISEAERLGVGKVKRLTFSRCLLDKAVAGILFDRMGQSDSLGLQQLNVVNAHSDLPDLFLSRAFLGDNDKLQQLNLSGNVVQPIEKPGLRYNHDLRALILNECTFKDGTMAFLADDLQLNRHLVTFSMDQTPCGDEGAKVLAKGLKHNHTLTRLFLSACQIGVEGMQALAETLADHSVVTVFKIDGNLHQDQWLPFVERQLLKNPNLLATTQTNVGLTPAIDAHQKQNEACVKRLQKLLISDPYGLSTQDFRDLELRLPAYLGQNYEALIHDKDYVAKQIAMITEAAKATKNDFKIPVAYHQFIDAFMPDDDDDHVQVKKAPAETPRPQVDVATLKTPQDLRLPVEYPAYYQLVERNDPELLMSTLARMGDRLTAEEWLFKPEGRYRSALDMLSSRRKLPLLLDKKLWQGDLKGLETVLAALPEDAAARQMKGDGRVQQLQCAVKGSVLATGRRFGKNGPNPT